MKQTIRVSGMTCSHCKRTVEAIIKEMAPGAEAEANIITGEVELDVEEELSAEALKNAFSRHPEYRLEDAGE